MFTIKEISTNLNITPQAIYKQKNELIAKGYMKKNEFNQWELTEDGYNYLKDKQINRIKQFTSGDIQQVENHIQEHQEKEAEKPETLTNDHTLNLLLNQFKEQITTLQNQLKEEQEQKEYFKLKFEEKDNLLNQYINAHLLTPGEQKESLINIETKNNKKGFFRKFFNK